jgi:large subunit ribosomal protein L18
MQVRKESRLRRAKKGREKMKELGAVRLCVNRTPQHIYAQVIFQDGPRALTLASASSLEKDFKDAPKGEEGKVGIAIKVGSLLAKRAKEKGIEKLSFDRSGFKYHGRVKALADAVREHGIQM